MNIIDRNTFESNSGNYPPLMKNEFDSFIWIHAKKLIAKPGHLKINMFLLNTIRKKNF